MFGANLLVFVVLCSVVGPLSARVAEEGKNDFSLMKKLSGSSRLDSDYDPISNFTLAPGAVTSDLFGQCRAQADSALARFKQITLESGGQYTRYVPSDDQRSTYTPAWVPVTSVPINSVLECCSFADQRNSMMFKYDGTICSLSDLRLSMSTPKCGDQTAEAYFVRTSCPEPGLSSVNLTPSSTGMGVAWTPQDPCSLATKYRVSWSGGSHTTADASTLDYTVSGLSGCQSVAFTVVALDSADAPFGQSVTMTDETNSETPVVSNVTVKATGLVTYEVTWDLHDPCNLVDSFSLDYSWDSGAGTATAIASPSDRMTSQILDGCSGLEVTVRALDDSAGELGSETSDPDVPLFSAQCDHGFFSTCSGCLFQGTWRTSYNDAVDYCTDLESESEVLTVASGDELDAMRDFLNDNFPGAEQRFWVNLHKLGSDWVWSTQYVQPLTRDWFGTEPNTNGASCAYVRRDEQYKIGDIDCPGALNSVYGMCFYN